MSRNHVGGQRWLRLRRAKLNSVGWRCERCKRRGRLEVHHRVALEDGGPYWVGLDGLEALCRDCHIEHHRRPRALPEPAERWRDFAAELH